MLELDLKTAGLEELIARLKTFAGWKEFITPSIGGFGLDFVNMMQDNHLSGGTTEDRLARRSSNLFNSIFSEVVFIDGDPAVHIGFLSAVQAYAPTHEYGDAARNIPARMNLRTEGEAWMPKFRDAISAAVRG